MCRPKMTEDIIQRTRDLLGSHSNAEICEKLNVSLSTVKRIIKENGFERTPEEKGYIRSRSRKDLIRAERRRAIFGLDQKTDIKVFTNRERNRLKYCLKRHNYRFLKRGENTAYIDDQTARHQSYEERGRKLGIRFIEIQNQ